jgi:hypothetical protein
MSRRVRPARVTRLHTARLERERREWLAIPEADLSTGNEWRTGFCEGLRIAQILIRKGE